MSARGHSEDAHQLNGGGDDDDLNASRAALTTDNETKVRSPAVSPPAGERGAAAGTGSSGTGDRWRLFADRPWWVTWQLQRQPNGKISKVPHSPGNGRPTNVRNLSLDQGTRAEAEAAARRRDHNGVGIVIGHQLDELGLRLCCIDLDACIRENGSVKEWAHEIIELFRPFSYVEVSPSGRGVKVFFMRRLRDGIGNKKAARPDPDGGEKDEAIEFLCDGYLTVTGKGDGTMSELKDNEPLKNAFEAIENFAPKKTRRDRPRNDDRGDSLNARALANTDLWVPALFDGTAKKTARGIYRVSSAALGRDLQEDLSISPEGICDFGVADMGDDREGKRTPVELVMEHRKVDTAAAAAWLREALGIEELRPPGFSDDALALRFADEHADDLRHVSVWGRWYVLDDGRWEADETLLGFDLARRVCREAAVACDQPRLAATLASAKTVAAIERLAKADRRLAATVDQWDADEWTIGAPGSDVDLRTGEYLAHDPGRYITKRCGVAPAEKADCPRWLDFLRWATCGDDDLTAYLKRWFGYALTGSTREQAMVFFYGTGGNGKGVLLRMLAHIMGDYASTAPMDTFTESYGDKHSTDLAMLRGARVVMATETEEGRRWAEAKVKQLTGGDPITARFMRQDNFTFTPQFKLLISGNHKPGIRSVDEAIRRRMHLVPFNAKVSNLASRDPDFEARLREEEGPAVLRWAIDGCLEWQRIGLAPPRAVVDATEDYLESEDAVGRFLKERCRMDPNAWTSSAAMWGEWEAWAKREGAFIGHAKLLLRNLEKRGIESKQKGKDRVRAFVGVEIIGGSCDVPM